MSPKTPLSPGTLSRWMLEIVESPLREFEATRVLDRASATQRPEVALSVDEEGVPVWWPLVHPQEARKLTPAKRRRWFLDWLAGELKPVQESLTSAGPKLRRRMIAESLLLTHSELNPYELPTPDWL